MESGHGTTQKTSDGREERLLVSQRKGLGEIQHSGSINEPEPVGTRSSDSTREDSAWKLTPIRDTTAGKILERLESLESRYIEYVDSHQARLKARLEESKEDKEDFLQESNQIKSDIYHLAIAQQKSDGNGHTN
jgi:hypothetical protein